MDETSPPGLSQAHVAVTFALHGDAGTSVPLGCPDCWFSNLFIPHTHTFTEPRHVRALPLCTYRPLPSVAGQACMGWEWPQRVCLSGLAWGY